MSNEREAPRDPSARLLDRALRVAYGSGSGGPPTVLDALGRLTGAEPPRVHLPDAPGGADPSPIVRTDLAQPSAPPQGRGAYRVLGEIGKGGMGEVLRAHDPDLGRDVALKVLAPELARRPDAVQRFVEEAQIGGQLQHPGIVPVYELGLMADDRPFFAMKLVKGRTLAALLAESRERGAQRGLLEVFASVCQTMAYAHSRGVIHRDLKPSNVLIGAFGEVQVVDWGLAKVLRRGGIDDERKAWRERESETTSVVRTVRSGPDSPGSHSLVGSVLGTPQYMAPEQALGQVDLLDERSDVFALGAILCEILTGAPPYAGSRDDVLEQARNVDLEDAHRRLSACGADPELAELCEQCLAILPSARPRSAEVLAQRLSAHQASVEERAQRSRVEAAEARVRAQDERRARRLTSALAATVVVAVLGGAGAWLFLERAADREERKVEGRVDKLVAQAEILHADGRLAEALAAARRATEAAASSAAAPAVRERAAEAEARLQVAHEREQERAELLSRLEAILGVEGRASSVAAASAAAVAESVGQDSATAERGADLRWERQEAYRRDLEARDRAYRDLFLGELGLDMGAPAAEGVERLAEVDLDVELARTMDDWAFVLAKLDGGPERSRVPLGFALELDEDPLRRRLRKALLDHDNEVLLEAARDDTALPPATALALASYLRAYGWPGEARALLERAVQEAPGDFRGRLELGKLLLRAPGHEARAARNLEAAAALRPDSATAHFHLGRALRATGEVEEAVRELRRASELDSEDPHARANLAFALLSAGDTEEAIQTARQGVELAPEHSGCRDALAIALASRGAPGDLAAAESNLRRAVELDGTNAAAHYNLANVLEARGERDEAVRFYCRAIELDSGFAVAHNNLAVLVAADPARLEEAIAGFRRAVEADPDYAEARENLGIALQRAGRPAQALEAYRATLEIDPERPTCMINLSWLLATAEDEGLRDPAKAVELAQRAVEVDGEDAEFLGTLGVALYRAGRLEEAIGFLERASERREGGVDAESFFLAMAYGRSGRRDEARDVLRRAGQWLASKAEPAPWLERFRDEARALLEAPGEGR